MPFKYCECGVNDDDDDVRFVNDLECELKCDFHNGVGRTGDRHEFAISSHSHSHSHLQLTHFYFKLRRSFVVI